MFALGTFSGAARAPFVGLCIEERIFPLADVNAAWSGSRPSKLAAAPSILALVETWEESLDVLRQLADFVRREGEWLVPVDPSGLRYHPPISRPGKMLHSAANFREHVAEMAAYNVAAGAADPGKRFTGDKAGARPYLFLKAPSALTGPYDDIVLPGGEHQIDWEAELAAVIGRRGRRVRAQDALAHVAGYMVTNDVSCRDLLWREDRQNFRTDWLASKSHDSFAPMGPLFVPAIFVSNPGDLRIRLRLNGIVKQDGSTSAMIYSLEEQIEYASHFMTLDPGDIFVTGTVGGVGQGRGEYLKPGDLVETQIEGVGMMRNRVAGASGNAV